MQRNPVHEHVVRMLISGSHQKLLGVLLWVPIFLAVVCILGLFAAHHLRADLRADAAGDIAQLDEVKAGVEAAFAKLRTEVTATPCSAEFHKQLRRVAFIPDGLNEFLFAPQRQVLCSTSRERFTEAVPLGPPDRDDARGGPAVWIDMALDPLGLAGLRAMVVHQDQFAIVIPPETIGAAGADWVRKELVLTGPQGVRWHRAGEAGIYDRVHTYKNADGGRVFHELVCDKSHFYCVASETSLAAVFKPWSTPIFLAIALAGCLAAWLAAQARDAIKRYWSIEARFCRHLTDGSVVCAYQPILDLRSGKISGCEVLARWRDLDGSIVFPDRFISLVERENLTRVFTRAVVEKAFAELSAQVPPEWRLQLNFNIFPCDLDSAVVSEWFAIFKPLGDRFDIVVEIVESDAVAVETAQREIEALARAGIRTYIDDFGVGYSNIQNLASLAVHGVKLDRAFGMAPESSMLAKMLVHALDMIGTAGRALVVEGVESRERLELLKTSGRADFAQGYLISRPLPIGAFVRFLKEHADRAAGEASADPVAA